MSLFTYYVRVFFNYSPKLAIELASGFFAQVALLFEIWFFLITRKTILRGKNKTFNFIFKNKEFSLTLNSVVDIAVLAEVFVLKEYQWPLEHGVTNILDLGAHWGDSSIYYAINYPEATIFAVEPTPVPYSRLEAVSKQFNNIVPIEGALSSKVGTQKLFISSTTFGNSFTNRNNVDDEIIVKTYDFGAFCDLAKVKCFDLVKFDIEGAESYIFENSKIKDLSTAFIGEIHLDLMDFTLDDIKKYFFGFKLDIEKISEKRYILRAVKN
ncbi:FkbM family methyltransferase [Candidatus Nomurabacteria bacterium]|nr:FkbM family methyltransferase [Candidatus Nomurabacteria bacterium]